jgi:hypothetical protein
MLEDTAPMLPPYLPGGEKWKIDVRFYKQSGTKTDELEEMGATTSMDF